ncbi:MAG: hypothetical protein K0R65_263 [Crocinitomicaceae bacterium]|jgi:hypothetical protein|nr:hypothetical protein [Crocinitomicaceae bacterium]
MLEENRKEILDLLHSKAALKQDIHEDTLNVFQNFKRIMQEEVQFLKTQLTDQRIRMQYIDKGLYESQIFIGSDLLFFHMHTNVFLLPDEHPFWKLSYLKKNRDNGYFGIIYIYNFLAQSILQSREDDPGYLIGRIFVNKEGHFFIEGQGALGANFKNVEKGILTDDKLRDILYKSFCFASQFELLTPPFDLMSQVNVMQIQEISSTLNLQTGKRLGFKFSAEDQDFYTIK